MIVYNFSEADVSVKIDDDGKQNDSATEMHTEIPSTNALSRGNTTYIIIISTIQIYCPPSIMSSLFNLKEGLYILSIVYCLYLVLYCQYKKEVCYDYRKYG